MRLTHLEDTLYLDTQGCARDQAVQSLQAEQARLLVCLARPHTTDDYRTLSNSLAACEAAVAVVATLWSRYHRARR